MKLFFALTLACMGTLLSPPKQSVANSSESQTTSLSVSPAPVALIASRVLLGANGQVASNTGRIPHLPDRLTTLCWDNSATPPLAGNFLPGDEIVDWGVKSCLMTGLVRSFRIGYRTMALDPGAGGSGAALTVAFYEGTGGNGVLGVQVARYVLTGMPASSVAGVPTNHSVDIDLGDFPFCIADGQIGFGFTSDDGITQPLMTAAPNSILGTQNLLDQYSPGPAQPGSFIQSFDLGPTSPFASLYLRLVEDSGTIKASSTIVNGSGVNPVIFSEIAPAILGENWLTKIDLLGFPAANFTALVVSISPPLMIGSNFGELLVDLTDPAAIVTLSFGIHALAIPKDAFILGQTFHSQAAVFQSMGLPTLTNGIDLVPGF